MRKESTAPLDTFTKAVLTLIWAFASMERLANLSILLENCAGTTCMDFVKKVQNAPIITPKFLLRKTS